MRHAYAGWLQSPFPFFFCTDSCPLSRVSYTETVFPPLVSTPAVSADLTHSPNVGFTSNLSASLVGNQDWPACLFIVHALGSRQSAPGFLVTCLHSESRRRCAQCAGQVRGGQRLEREAEEHMFSLRTRLVSIFAHCVLLQQHTRDCQFRKNRM